MSGFEKSCICESYKEGSWYVESEDGYTRYGGSLDRAKDVLLDMKYEDPYFKNKTLRLVWHEIID
jgi:hypothetical protein